MTEYYKATTLMPKYSELLRLYYSSLAGEERGAPPPPRASEPKRVFCCGPV